MQAIHDDVAIRKLGIDLSEAARGLRVVVFHSHLPQGRKGEGGRVTRRRAIDRNQ